MNIKFSFELLNLKHFMACFREEQKRRNLLTLVFEFYCYCKNNSRVNFHSLYHIIMVNKISYASCYLIILNETRLQHKGGQKVKSTLTFSLFISLPVTEYLQSLYIGDCVKLYNLKELTPFYPAISVTTNITKR
jgi:hypothetical protein